MSRKPKIERIDVTKTFLPPLAEYTKYLEEIWSNVWLTNQGPLVERFEDETNTYLGVEGLQFVGNGTLALQVALRALNITEGEVITTPFSYVATTSAILWERCTPVFVDIEPDSLCIDAEKIEAAITEETKAILAVHVFGFPCNVERIEEIAKKHNLKVIYDGAHAFGVDYKGKSLLSYGDVSTCSFHATKLFQTIEGGCIIAKDEQVIDKIELIKHFGHKGDEHHTLGINTKASEFQAAMGLCSLNYIDDIITKRRHLAKLYDELLDTEIEKPRPASQTTSNYAYYPIIFENETKLLQVVERLNKENIFPRRYFYPSLNTLPYVDGEACPISEDISLRIICLPLYPDLKEESIRKIAKIINDV